MLELRWSKLSLSWGWIIVMESNHSQIEFEHKSNVLDNRASKLEQNSHREGEVITEET